jgi:hypothetical protein
VMDKIEKEIKSGKVWAVKAEKEEKTAK